MMFMDMPDLGNAFSKTFVLTKLGETILIEAHNTSHNAFLIDVYHVDSTTFIPMDTYPLESHLSHSLAELNKKIQQLVYKWSSWAGPMIDFKVRSIHPVS